MYKDLKIVIGTMRDSGNIGYGVYTASIGMQGFVAKAGAGGFQLAGNDKRLHRIIGFSFISPFYKYGGEFKQSHLMQKKGFNDYLKNNGPTCFGQIPMF